MNIGGWEYPFETLPRWDLHEKMGFVEDRLIEPPKADMAALLYSVAEVPMGWYSGTLAVLKNKAAPQLCLNPVKTRWAVWGMHFGLGGNYLFLCAGGPVCGREYPFVVINVPDATFSVIRIENGYHYSVMELEDAFKLEAKVDKGAYKFDWIDGRIFKYSEMVWLPVAELDDLGGVLKKFPSQKARP